MLSIQPLLTASAHASRSSASTRRAVDVWPGPKVRSAVAISWGRSSAAADHQHADRLLYCILPFTIGIERGPLPRAVFVMSEPELIDGAIGEPDTGDARLLEIGRKAGTCTPVYADPGRTLLLLPPPLLQRMQAAQHRARALS
ncbi:hypothetical protein MW290_12115 [Aquincola tertiaricarbonis]|uniref:Uncharacterized protein n=1 Tax=Aquincola tertiaricarbonis TaxID=391953 RepID=A0ABY4S442_AQUTE|nr:hypothetical protein [Aquincola tertiaricarbonis]URI06642.1 hypothetical protein MW290_12115 [Aquincola tertiaricarbonis]